MQVQDSTKSLTGQISGQARVGVEKPSLLKDLEVTNCCARNILELAYEVRGVFPMNDRPEQSDCSNGEYGPIFSRTMDLKESLRKIENTLLEIRSFID